MATRAAGIAAAGAVAGAVVGAAAGAAAGEANIIDKHGEAAGVATGAIARAGWSGESGGGSGIIRTRLVNLAGGTIARALWTLQSRPCNATICSIKRGPFAW